MAGLLIEDDTDAPARGLLAEGFDAGALLGLLSEAIDEGRARYGSAARAKTPGIVGRTPRETTANVEAALQYLLGPHVTAGADAVRQAMLPDAQGLLELATSAGDHLAGGDLAQGLSETAQLPLSAALEAAPGPNAAHGAPLLAAMARHVLGDDFPKIPFATTIAKLKRHPDYKAAKYGGDVRAADNLVGELFKPEKLAPLAERLEGRAPMVTPVVLMEAGASDMNMIPMALAKHVADALDGGVARHIVQTNVAGHTGADMGERLIRAPQFAGEVNPFNDYLVVDDVVTGGSTLAELIGHLKDGGARVAGAHTLAGAYGSSKLPVASQTLGALRDKHGRTEQLWRDVFGYGFDALTEKEARFLGGAGADAVRDLIAARAKRGGVSGARGPQ